MTQFLLKIFSLSRYDSASSDAEPGHRSIRLHLLFLGPLVFTIIILVLVFIVLRYQHANDDVQSTVFRLKITAQDFYENSLLHETDTMRGIIEVMKHRADLSRAIAQRDRRKLLKITEKQFQSLNRHFNVTHFYFMDVDRVNLLRVHTPLRFGDSIERTTMLMAESSGEIASGVELGKLGTFTLRVVSPWYNHQKKLIGYIELGMEIDQILKNLQESLNVQLITVINKKYLDRENWIKGMQELGRAQDWDHFQDVIINKYAALTTPVQLVNFLENEGSIADYDIRSMKYKSREHRVIALPLMDINDRNVAQIIMTADVTQMQSDARDAVYTVGFTALALGGTLLIFLNWLIGGITQRLECDEDKLRELATRDGLTNLYNQRTFYIMLKDNVDRASRYNRPVSLLLLDIDHFKAVNDSYGHLAGDAILRGLSQRLIGRLRTTDRVCRYGGEEITIILPETETDIAVKVAEDIRHLVEREPFYIGKDQYINITVSIGIATAPQHAKETSELVSDADTALYEAKDRGRNLVCIYQSQ